MARTKQTLVEQPNSNQQAKNNKSIVEIDCLTYNKIKNAYYENADNLVEYLLTLNTHNYNSSKLKKLITTNITKYTPICGRCYCYTSDLKLVKEKAKRNLSITLTMPKYKRPYNLDDIAAQYEKISTTSGVNMLNKNLFKNIVKDYFEIFWEMMLNDYEYDFGYNIGKIYPIRDKYNRVRVDPRKVYTVDNITYTTNKSTYYKMYWDKMTLHKSVNNRTLLYYWKFIPPDKVNKKLTDLSINDEKGYRVKITPPSFYAGQARVDDFIERANKGEIDNSYE